MFDRLKHALTRRLPWADTPTPASETDYGDYVERQLIDVYGEENVEREVYLGETYRFADFVVDAGYVSLAIELEHSTDKVVAEGFGQALLYAKHDPAWVPVVIYPPDGENDAELALVGEDVALVPMEHIHE